MAVIFVSICDEKSSKAQVKKEGRKGGGEGLDKKEEK